VWYSYIYEFVGEIMSETKKESLIEGIRIRKKKLMEEAVTDVFFDKAHMDTQFDNTLHIMKWINKKMEWGQLQRFQEEIRKKKFRTLYEFYKTESNLKITTKDEMMLFIESDINYLEIFNICTEIKEVMKYLDETIDALKAKSFERKDWITYQMFINGK
jgi:hypothetical protein